MLSHEQVYGAAVGAQMVVHVPAPAGERAKVTETSGRSEVAVADSGTLERSGVPGSLSEAVTALKTAEAANVVPAWSELATKVAWERPTPPERAAAASRTRRRTARFIGAPPRAPRPTPARGRRC